MMQDEQNQTETARALWTVAQGIAEIRREPLASPGPQDVRVRTLYSGLSRGTERLVFQGAVPASEAENMRGPHMEGTFAFPVKYGYCAVGIVEAGPEELAGRTVFCLHPHQDRFIVPASEAVPLPPLVPARRGIFAANMETALNALWDSGAGPGDRIVVIGAGVVGLSIASIAAAIPGTQVHVCDIDDRRRAIVQRLGASYCLPSEAPGEADVVFHASVSETGLALALRLAGFEATVVELSWYGDRGVTIPLGDTFHSRRLKLIASQVGHIAPSRRPRWNYARRMAMAMRLLESPVLDEMISEEVAFDDLPAHLPRLLAPGAPGLQTLIRY